MAKTKKSAQARKKKTVVSSSKNFYKRHSGKVKNPQHTYKTRSTRDPASSESDTSPFKGFSEIKTKGIIKPPQLFDSLNDDDLLSPVKIVEREHCDPFDKLLEDNHKSHFTKNIKTYSNKNKKPFQGNDLIDFQNYENRNEVIKWLNDTRNVFDRLTQTQSGPIDRWSQMTLDVPSVSQQHVAKINQPRRKSKRVHQSPYKTRAKSLDILIKKNSQEGRSKRHSFTGDTPDLESYDIEEVLTPIPAKEDAKIIILMEDEYLDNIEKELHDKKNQNGWDRIKDMNKSISVKKPKQLNIIKRGSPSDSNKKNGSVYNTKNTTYDYEILENYFVENMEKLLGENYRSCSNKSILSTVLDFGRSFVTSLKKLAETDKYSLNRIQPVVSELQNIFNSCKEDTLTVSTQTCVLPGLDKYIQTESNSVHFGVQTESNMVHCSVQTESNLTHTSVQTNEKVYVHKFVQTGNNKSDVEIQTDDLNHDQIPPSPGTSTPSDIFFLDENDKREITAALNDDFQDDVEGDVKENKSKEEDFDDELNYSFETEDVLKEISKSLVVEEKKVVANVQTAESVILVSTESNNNVVNQGTKRPLSESPLFDLENCKTKRPCAKFIDEDLSVQFSSQEEQPTGKGKKVQFSESSDDSDEFLADVLKKYNNSGKENAKLEITPKTRTQEQIEDLEDIINNATRSKPIVEQKKKSQLNQTELPPIKSYNVEDDMDYFNTTSCASEVITITTEKTTRRTLFNVKNEKVKSPRNLLSESLFNNDANNTVDCTLTKDNVDTVMKDVSINNEMKDVDVDADKEVEEIFQRSASKVIILENVVIQQRHDNNDTVIDVSSQSSDASDLDIVECTPQNAIVNISKHREESALDVTLPPPLEFQDSERFKLEKEPSKYEEDVSLLTPLRRPLAVVNKVTSTPLSHREDSEALTLSPISFRGRSNKALNLSNDSNQENKKPTVRSSPMKRVSIRNTAKHKTSVLEMAQQQFNKFCPLSIERRSQSQNSHNINLTPKQRSILNYIVLSPETPKSQTSNKSASFEGSGKRKPCITSSRLSKENILAISSLTNKKLATYSSSFTPMVTHLIVSVSEKNCLRDHTIKFVLAVASGIWVLNFEWIRQCLAKNALVPEEPFEVLDVTGIPGPQRARMNTSKPLLKGYKIYAAPHFTSTTRQEVENVIRLLGGIAVPSPEHLLDRNGYICVIVTEARATEDFEIYETWLEALKVITVDMEWLSRSVGQYQILSLRPFALCVDDSIDHLGYPAELTVNMTYSLSQQTFSSVPSST